MLFFGLGTLPTLLAASAGSQILLRGFQHPVTRQVIAVLMALYSALLIYRAIL
jgi:sulfite exporter TauE/SafE